MDSSGVSPRSKRRQEDEKEDESKEEHEGNARARSAKTTAGSTPGSPKEPFLWGEGEDSDADEDERARRFTPKSEAEVLRLLRIKADTIEASRYTRIDDGKVLDWKTIGTLVTKEGESCVALNGVRITRAFQSGEFIIHAYTVCDSAHCGLYSCIISRDGRLVTGSVNIFHGWMEMDDAYLLDVFDMIKNLGEWDVLIPRGEPKGHAGRGSQASTATLNQAKEERRDDS